MVEMSFAGIHLHSSFVLYFFFSFFLFLAVLGHPPVSLIIVILVVFHLSDRYGDRSAVLSQWFCICRLIGAHRAIVHACMTCV